MTQVISIAQIRKSDVIAFISYIQVVINSSFRLWQ